MTAQPVDGHYAQMADLLRRRRHLRVVSPEGETLEMTDEFAEKMSEVAAVLAQGQAVTVFGDESLISTTKAAEILGVSRQTVVRFVDSGRLRYSQPGVHRRLRLCDVLDVKKRSEELHRVIAEARSDAADHGLDDITLDEAVAAVQRARRRPAGTDDTRASE